MFTLQSRLRDAIAFDSHSPSAVTYQQHGSDVDRAGSIRAGRGDVQSGVPFVPIDMRQASRGEKMTNNRKAGQSGGPPGTGICAPGDPSPTIAESHPPAIAGGMTVRRLTPRECERLQGFPDAWTRLAADGREIKDGPRYRMLGNAVAVPVAEWIGRRIMQVEQEPKPCRG